MRTSRLALALVLSGTFSVWACGGSSGTRIPDVDAGTTSGGTSGTSGTSGTTPVEEDADVPAPDDAGPDAPPAGEVEIELAADALTQSCMPVVAADPVTMQGTITIRNQSNTVLPPLKFSKGAFLGLGGQVIATFATETTTPAVPPGETRSFLVEKASKSMSPAGGCSTVACGRDVIVELSYTGGRVGNVRATPIEMTCSF